ncbi:SDR family oxidoreductase [Mesorhizobium sp. YC-39]|uniref:SDR family NAD(P)-dependent oxidoreductase n=1 Tax=unclassified Mesorhizobium TaxID=325217 RepID=UPI0021E83078|nr:MULTISPECIES: SDR family oxidoreductase [unclassified Mesorhizobium]MCV3205146.1 SDR family oxidoreductase [Mesorhizobium sp. YC-2]MCV3228455.1 SDR family oxidoreductase [Mesorhizobium sp. YC-39]
MERRFQGKTAVVTGAGNGIGLATATRLQAEGAEVLFVDWNADYLADIAAPKLTIDLAADDAPARVAAAATAHFGTVDILVNNAGVAGPKALADSDDDLIDHVLGINIRAVMRLTRDMLPHISRPDGSIVNVCSVFGEVGFPNTAAYAASKGALSQLTRQLAADLSADGIRVNGVAPGVINTPIVAERIAADAWYRRAMIETTPIRRVGTAEDVAGGILFLCSDDARFITGHILNIDGGWLAARVSP